MPEYYIIALNEPDRRVVARVLKLLQRHNIVVENIVITIQVKELPRETGLLGGITHVDGVVVLKGVIPLPKKA